MINRKIVASLFAFTVFGAVYLIYCKPNDFYRPRRPQPKMSAIPDLIFKLSQISKSPPSLLVTLQNKSPTTTFTLLKWGTPLDPSALNLGVFQLFDEETGEQIKTDIIKIGRKMPPSRDQLQEIAPKTEHSIEVVFDKPWMPGKLPARYKVKAEGTYYAVWEKEAKDVQEPELEAYHESPHSQRDFVSSEVVLHVE